MRRPSGRWAESLYCRSGPSCSKGPMLKPSPDTADSDLYTVLTLQVPRHVAIIMDGNGRWARRRHLPRIAGHQAGIEAVRRVVKVCGEKGIRVLTLFAFSSENWRRPEQEVSMLMDLFMKALQREVKHLHESDVRLRIIGERSAFSQKLQERVAAAEALTAPNAGLNLVVAVNYGGRWDIGQAAQQVAERVEAGDLRAADVTPELLASFLCLHDLPEPDLFIRTGGEQRISNFLLWQLAYTELYFTDALWPDFDRPALEAALVSFARRQRRLGHTGEQVEQVRKKSLGG
jgi:undecaprenyl diphosphate synthase